MYGFGLVSHMQLSLININNASAGYECALLTEANEIDIIKKVHWNKVQKNSAKIIRVEGMIKIKIVYN